MYQNEMSFYKNPLSRLNLPSIISGCLSFVMTACVREFIHTNNEVSHSTASCKSRFV